MLEHYKMLRLILRGPFPVLESVISPSSREYYLDTRSRSWVGSLLLGCHFQMILENKTRKYTYTHLCLFLYLPIYLCNKLNISDSNFVLSSLLHFLWNFFSSSASSMTVFTVNLYWILSAAFWAASDMITFNRLHRLIFKCWLSLACLE